MIIIFTLRPAACLRKLRRLAGGVAFALGCSSVEKGPTETAEDATRNRSVLSSLVESCFVPNHAAFAEAASDLDAAARAYGDAPGAATRDAARDAWRAAMRTWQRLELSRGLGPAAPQFDCVGDEIVGGRDLAFEVYSWPLPVACRVDIALVDGTYAAEPSETNPPRRGLDALEYLLFAETAENACDAASRINADGEWDALGAEEITRRRTEYVELAARHVRRIAEELATAWSEEGGFGGELANAGAEGSAFPTSAAAVGWVTEAALYVDGVTKDRKLACPTEIIASLPDGTSCPSEFESPFAAISTLAVQENLDGFLRLFTGCGEEGQGLLDLLPSAESKLGEDVQEGIEDARAAAQGIAEESLSEAVARDRTQVEAAHGAIQSFVALVKTEFREVVQLDTPACGAGDAD